MLLVFTDLDGTLLDHHSYAWTAARDALDALRQRQDPVILVSSKTLAEIREYREALSLPHPVVAENGAVIDVPENYFPRPLATSRLDVSRHYLQRYYRHAKQQGGYRCDAFFELGLAGIMRETGLSESRAALANERIASEPILWRDSEERREAFVASMVKAGLRCVMGGRFLHLMPDTDKGEAVRRLLAAYRDKYPGCYATSVSLGDGPNDLDMLHSTDIAVVIPGEHNHPMPMHEQAQVIYASAKGPVGWNRAVLEIIAARNNNPENGIGE